MCNESMVYLNKVFSNQCVKSCPTMAEIAADSETFNQQLTFLDECDCCGNNGCGNGCGCGCNCGCGNGCLDMSDDLNFVVESTEVIISDFDLDVPQNLSPNNVTIDGIPVDGIDYFNQRYMAGTNELMTRISDCTCIEKGKSTKGYFLICNAGPWKAKLTIVVIGSVFGCGSCKRFKLCMTTKNGVYINLPGSNTFAASSICLPCTTGGIAPVVNFSFGAQGSLLNPVVTANPATGQCSVTLTGCLIIEPICDIEVTRQTLFKTDAESLNVPCDDIEKCRECSGTCGGNCGNNLKPVDKCCDDACESKGSSCGCGAETKPVKPVCCQYNGCNGCNF